MAHRLPPRVEASDDSKDDDKKKQKQKSKKSETQKKQKKSKKNKKEDEEDEGMDSDHDPLDTADDHDNDDGGGSAGLDDGIPGHLKPPSAKKPSTRGRPTLKRPATGKKHGLGSDDEQDPGCVWNMGHSHKQACNIKDFSYYSDCTEYELNVVFTS